MFCTENNEKIIRCHLKGLSNSEIPVKISCCKCKNCSNVMEQKSYCASAKRDLYGHSLRSTLKMTDKAQSFLSRCCASEKQKKSSLILRKAKFQAIFKFFLSSASGGAGGGKYNRISAFVSMPVLLIRRSLEFFRVPRKNRDDRFCFGFAKVLALALLFSLNLSTSWAACNNGDFSCNGRTGTSAYCCYKVTGIDVNGKKSIEVYKDPAAPSGVEASIGNGAFWGNKSISSIDIKDVENIGFQSIVALPYLTKVNMPNVKSIGGSAFNQCTNLTYIGWPVNTSYTPRPYGGYPFVNVPALSNCVTENGFKHCGTCNNYIKTGTGCVKDCGAGYLGKEGRCIDASNGCGAGYRQFENFCNRIRYTPAEAAQVLTDDNNNSVTITFRK